MNQVRASISAEAVVIKHLVWDEVFYVQYHRSVMLATITNITAEMAASFFGKFHQFDVKRRQIYSNFGSGQYSNGWLLDVTTDYSC
jgi:hypothetical protein